MRFTTKGLLIGGLLLAMAVAMTVIQLKAGLGFGLVGAAVEMIFAQNNEGNEGVVEGEDVVWLPSMNEAQFLAEDEGRSCHYEGNCSDCHPHGYRGEWKSVPLSQLEEVACGGGDEEYPEAEFTGTDMVKQQKSLAPLLLTAVVLIGIGLGVHQFGFDRHGTMRHCESMAHGAASSAQTLERILASYRGLGWLDKVAREERRILTCKQEASAWWGLRNWIDLQSDPKSVEESIELFLAYARVKKELRVNELEMAYFDEDKDEEQKK